MPAKTGRLYWFLATGRVMIKYSWKKDEILLSTHKFRLGDRLSFANAKGTSRFKSEVLYSESEISAILQSAPNSQHQKEELHTYWTSKCATICFAIRQNLRHFCTKMHRLTTLQRAGSSNVLGFLFTPQTHIHLTLVTFPNNGEHPGEGGETARTTTHAVEVKLAS